MDTNRVTNIVGIVNIHRGVDEKFCTHESLSAFHRKRNIMSPAFDVTLFKQWGLDSFIEPLNITL